MFENLVESQVKRQRSWGQGLISLVVHGGLIFAAVKATQGVAETIRERPVETKMLLMKPPEPAPRAPAPPPTPHNVVVTVNPPPKGFKTLVAPIDIPKVIPPVDLNEKPFDPRDYTGKGVEGGIAAGVVGGTGPVDAVIAGGGVYSPGELDDPVQQISIPTPRYPPALQSMGIQGSVELQYVVDTTGHAEPNSFQVLSQTHPAFVEPAKEAILKGVFKPARFRGHPVRQLVRQPVRFKVGQ